MNKRESHVGKFAKNSLFGEVTIYAFYGHARKLLCFADSICHLACK